MKKEDILKYFKDLHLDSGCEDCEWQAKCRDFIETFDENGTLCKFMECDNEPECEFKPYDKVLVRYEDDDKWEANFFAALDKDEVNGKEVNVYCVMSGFAYSQCIPYEGNEYLVGKKIKPRK